MLFRSEADLRIHLGRQSQAPVSLMSVTDLDGNAQTVDARQAQRLQASPGMLLYDVLDEPRLQTAGRLIWEEARRQPHVVVGSSGVEYGLAAHWRASGTIPQHTRRPFRESHRFRRFWSCRAARRP